MAHAPRTRPGLLHDRRGSAALEAAMIMLPFLMMLFFVMAVGIQLFTQATLDSATRWGARQVRIGTIRGTSDAALRSQICGMMSGLATCSALQIYVTSGPSFATLTPATIVNGALTRTGFAPGGSDAFVLVQVAYATPALLAISTVTPSTFVSSFSFRNEP